MYVMGISCFFHDAAAAILRDGWLVAAAEEERFTRKKHDYGFPLRAIAFCLRQAGIRGEDLEAVVFFEKPFLKFDRILRSTMQTFPQSRQVFQDSMISWLADKLWVKALIKRTLGVPDGKILFSDHHLSHAASAFFCSPFEEAAVLTVDGVGEWATATWGIGRGTDIRLLREIRFPHSLGLLYSTFTAYLGFEVNEGEYKVMGMAPFGRPRYADKVWQLLHQDADGSFRLNMKYFAFHRSRDTSYSDAFIDLFGPPRPPDAHFFTPGSGYPSYFGARPLDYDRLARQNEHYADVAASIQLVTEEVLLAMARHLQGETGLTRLCFAGGVALNSVANGRILRETPFEELYIQPAAGDSGGAVGAALYGHHVVLGKPRQFVMEHAYWGEEFGPDQVDAFLKANNVHHARLENDDALLARVVDAIQDGAVVGWYQGRSEWGPRALGNRSILADPRDPAMKDIVNTKIKFREPFRPFAPSVLAERAGDFFDLPDAARHFPARYMLYVVDVKPELRERVPAITHVDGTARLQTVDREVAPRYHRLIETFGHATGVPVLLNTSFNLKGEPIVNTPAEAFSTFARSGMDVLVMGHHLVDKKGDLVR
jgi:carbamoyltransferase